MTQQATETRPENTATPKSWQQGFAAELQHSPSGRGLRASGAGRCVRRQTYAASGTPESDGDDDRSPARLALGHALEVLIVLNMKREGWETENTVLDGGQAEIALAEMPWVTGHPDGKCRHPKHTNGMKVVLECKSMGPQRGELVFADGIFAHYEEYRSQIAVYGRQLYREGKVDHPERGVFAMMDREGKPLAPERVAWQPMHFDQAVNRLREAQHHAENGTLPERPYAPDSVQCTFCPFRTRCWELAPPPAAASRAIWRNQSQVKLDDLQLAQRVANYAAAMKDRKEVTKILEEECHKYGDANIEIGGLVAGYFYPSDSVSYDENKLAKYLTAEQIRECRAHPPTRRFWIRPASNRG